MKLKFKNQDFQTDAVNSVVDLFAGMAKGVNMFLVDDGAQVALTGDLGEGNAIVVDDDMLLQNMHTVQKRNNLPLTDANWIGPNLIPDAEPLEYRERTFPQFSIEMETGTGKTYVYTKTIFELNRKYGLTKFIIVVPSVAIREGVYKSFEVTKEHFGLQYDNVPCRYFIYNSAKLSDVRQFATSANIEIMIINIDAFKKAENIINQAQDKLNGDSAMRYIQDTHVKMFFKIPDRFKIDTPIGSYNPDWAVYLTKNGEEKLYFILETKGSDSFMDLRTREQLKIHCGKKHFEALDNGIEMQVATDWREIKARV